ncbi:MAG: sensor histidine kinase [Kordiimonas sp.]
MFTSRQKADALAICAISIGLPAYYKVKFFLGGQIGWKEIWSPAGLIEIVWAFCLACLLVVLYRKVGPLLASKMPNASKRFMPLLTVAMSALVAVAFTRFFFVYVVEWGSGDAFEFDIALLAIMLPLILSGVGERIFLEGKAKEQALKASMAETEALTAKYEALKARLSPHFLFNSLNTLADIVEDDPKLAVRFIDKMAETYRYILDNRDKQTVSLKEEVESIEALLFVLETRHPSALSVSIDLPVTGEGWEVVPLTLQTLLENALKHNHYSSSAPLEVRVYGDGGELVVENKLNKRTQVPSTKVGLDSLMQRVGQVCGRPVAIVEDGLKFQVRVPMLRPAAEAVR